MDAHASARLPIEEGMTVNEIVQQHPETLRVFHSVGIDTCCGGALAVAEAARRHALDLAELMHALREVAGEGAVGTHARN